jgi:hypothetical protein
MQDGDNLYHRRSPVHNHVLIHAKEEDIPAGQVGTPMPLARNVGQVLEGINQFALIRLATASPASPRR